jgi:NTP pyrophosphatase (non-canonical NTP hydrolase)
MNVSELQKEVDNWIKKYGVRYFDVRTNTLLLMEEVGEFSRLIARMYGEQSFKTEITIVEQQKKLQDELADILFVLICLANQTDTSLQEVMEKNLEKKSQRDNLRHHKNPKLGG